MTKLVWRRPLNSAWKWPSTSHHRRHKKKHQRMKSMILVLTSSLVPSAFVICEQTWVPSMIIDYYLLLYNLYYDPAICTLSLGEGLGRRPLNSARIHTSRPVDLTLLTAYQRIETVTLVLQITFGVIMLSSCHLREILGIIDPAICTLCLMHAYVDLAPQTTKATHQIEHGDRDSRRLHRVWYNQHLSLGRNLAQRMTDRLQ